MKVFPPPVPTKMSNLTPYRKPDDLEDTLKKYSLEALEAELAKRKNLDLIEKYKKHIKDCLLASDNHIYIFEQKFRFTEYLRFGIVNVNDKKFDNITEEIALIMGLKIYTKDYRKYIKNNEVVKNNNNSYRSIEYILNKHIGTSAGVFFF